MIKILDICSGIGGFSLGLEATGGFDTVAFCEFDDFCCKVLNKHWPNVPIYKDLKEIGNDPERIIQEFDLICGGIPCQPFSLAGKQKGKEDDRHLWPYMYAIVKSKKPTWVIVENVGGFVNVALDDVCLDLETQGYATQSFIIPACSVEAPHKRDRIWILGKLYLRIRETFGRHRQIRTHGNKVDNRRKNHPEGVKNTSQLGSNRQVTMWPTPSEQQKLWGTDEWRPHPT
jgi:DNA (cytosine-5)-methyltransferase 1